MKFDSFDDTRTIDTMLFELAMYDITKGLLPIIDSKEAYQKLSIDAVKRFNYFKRQIQLGEYTFDSIRDDVLTRNGPYYQKNLTDDEIIDDLLVPKKDKPVEVMTRNQANDAIIAMEEMIRILKRNSVKNLDGFNDEDIDGLEDDPDEIQ
jgi:hypothetical protein